MALRGSDFTMNFASFVKSEVCSKMTNIDQSLVRSEYKASIYVRYLLTALRFMMSVHTIHKTHLDVLDTMTDGYLKKWLGIPSRGANIAPVHLPQGMAIPRFSDVYWKAKTAQHIHGRGCSATNWSSTPETPHWNASQGGQQNSPRYPSVTVSMKGL